MSFAWHEIRDHLLQSSSTLSFQRRFDAIPCVQAAPGPFRDPATLLDGLQRGPGDADDKNLVLTALVEAAQGDGPAADCALTVLLLALWPGLDAIRRRSIWRRIGSTDEITSDVLARTTEAIRGLDRGRVSRIAATVLRNVERDMIRARQREVARERAAIDIDPDDVTADQAGLLATSADADLRNDIGKVIGADAALVIRVALEGFTQAEVSVELGLSEAAARKRYQRAMGKLRDVFREIS